MAEKVSTDNSSSVNLDIFQNPTPNLIRCIGWNWRSLNMNKILFTNYLIELHKPDWVIINETWLNKTPTGIDKRYDWFRTKDADHQGVMIIAKKDTVLKAYMNDEPYILAVELNNSKIFIIGVYMKEEMKNAILEELRTLINRMRKKFSNPNIIVYGDFNNNQHWKIEKIEKTTKLKWSDQNKKLITREQQMKDKKITSTLDYFLTSGEILNITTAEKGESDHLPIIANIKVNYTNRTKVENYIYKTEYSNNEESMRELLNSNWPENWQLSRNIFKKKLKIRPVIKMQNKANQIIKEDNSWNDKTIKLNDLRRSGFIEYMKNLDISLKTDKKIFYNILNSVIKYKAKGKLVRGIKWGDTILYGREKDTFVKNHYEKLYDSIEQKSIIVNNRTFNYHCDIVRAIETLSRSNAAGTDGIPSKIYRQDMNSPIISKIKNSFNEWIQNCTTPDYLMEGRLVIISKDKTDLPDIKDTRPISILPAITKIFETSILHNLEQITTNSAFNKNQRGFTKGKSTLDNIKDVIDIARQLRDRKAKNDTPALIFFDFCKAYDSVSRELLITKLIKFNTPCNIVKLIQNMLSWFKIKIGQETIPTKKGLVQGSVLSPILFNIFINDLMNNFEINGIESRAYADDIVWICISTAQIQKATSIMSQWCSQNAMKINEKKSGILRILKRTGKISTIENWLNIPEVSEYKYLGVVLNQSLRLNNHQQYIRSKVQALKKRINLLRPSLANMKTRLALYKTIIVPQLTYACKAIYNNHQQRDKTLRSALYQWLKSILWIRTNVSWEKLFSVLNLDTEINQELKSFKPNVIEHLSIKVIKLRTNCLFSKRKERTCTCNHKINSLDIVSSCKKLRNWRVKWSATLKTFNISLIYALFSLTSFKLSNINSTPEEIAEKINTWVNELTEWYFQK